MHDILAAAGCKVYIDAGDTLDLGGTDYSWSHYMSPNVVLHVSGAMESDESTGTYTFPTMKDAILGQ